MTRPLFDKGVPDEGAAGSAVLVGGVPRLRTPERRQVEMHWLSLDEMLAADHRARLVWQALGVLDLSHWLANIEAVDRQSTVTRNHWVRPTTPIFARIKTRRRFFGSGSRNSRRAQRFPRSPTG